MRKFLIHFLMFLMLLPGLACGPFMGKAHGAQTMQGMQGCHGMGGEKAQTIPDSGRFFFKDCMKADLCSADHVSVKAPDFSRDSIFTAAIIPAVYEFTPSSTHAIRGPPPDWPVISQTQPSILLTTQRLRI